jgi:hypothetical protein
VGKKKEKALTEGNEDNEDNEEEPAGCTGAKEIGICKPADERR